MFCLKEISWYVILHITTDRDLYLSAGAQENEVVWASLVPEDTNMRARETSQVFF